MLILKHSWDLIVIDFGQLTTFPAASSLYLWINRQH